MTISVRSRRPCGAILAVLAVAAAIGPPSPCAGQIPPAPDAPRPLAPDESLKRFQLAPGLRIELVASEPYVADPVAMDFDARGRIFVCEIHGYNLEGYLDVLELNKAGVLDKAVRRIPANAKAQKQAADEQYGTVKLLEDTDGDGRMDRAMVWADRLPPCYGVVAARQGVIVLCAPDILYLADRDGDGKAEVQEKLFSGFGLYDMWSRINNPRWGPDNWIYAANGIGSGGTIRGPVMPEPVALPNTAFRFKPDGTRLEPTAGSSSGFGLTINDWGDRFMVSNQQHVLLVAPLEHRYLARNPYYAAPKTLVNISTYGSPARVYPTSRPDPWRLARSKDPAWVRFYGVAEATANGFFTAASGQAIYQADLLGPEYRGNHFSVDNAQNLVHRCLLAPEGMGYAARRPKEDEKTELLTSTEQWFRPVNLMTGPDGGLYIVDMYRAIIEDYSAIPRYLQQIYIESLIAGADKGRIWRIVPEGARPPQRFDLAKATAAELVGELSHANAWWRLTAQRLLIERGDRSAAPALAKLVREGTSPQGRLHALYTLEGLGTLEPRLVQHALADEHFAVRMQALVLAERWLDKNVALMERVLAMVDDPEPRVRLQLALSLGQSKDSGAVRALRRIAARHAGESWIRSAVLSSSAETAQELLAAILSEAGEPDALGSLVQPLASIVGARHKDDELSQVLLAVADCPRREAQALRIACLDGLIEGLKRSKPAMLRAAPGQESLRKLLTDPEPQVAQRALSIAGLVKLRQSEAMKAAMARAAKVALDGSLKVEDRAAAVALLAGAPLADLAPVTKPLLDPRQPLDLQLAAVKALAAAEEPQAATLLLAHWASYTPKAQAAVMDAVFLRQDRLPALLEAIEKKVVLPSNVDALRRAHLLENFDPALRRRARVLLGSAGTRKDREEVLARYSAALGAARDAKRGQIVYEKQCAKCHQVQGKGYVVGPDLSSTTRRSDEMLVSDVLDPSNQITAGFNQYTVVTEDGRIFTGVLAAETATSVTLRKEQSADETILRKDIDEMAASSSSMMPENLEKEVTPQDVADLIAYLRGAFGPAPPPSVTLFDDEPGFPAFLREGNGKAVLETADRHFGAAALRMSPPQRFSSRIAGWQYRVTENPGPGEFRYLRFAWKSSGAAGVMIELAADGQWPPANKPLRRYYSGKNTTDWQALEVAPHAPSQWTVVTRDLWRDFGTFTLTGIAPTAMGGDALFDRIELLRALDGARP